MDSGRRLLAVLMVALCMFTTSAPAATKAWQRASLEGSSWSIEPSAGPAGGAGARRRLRRLVRAALRRAVAGRWLLLARLPSGRLCGQQSCAGPISIAQQAAQLRALMHSLGIGRATSWAIHPAATSRCNWRSTRRRRCSLWCCSNLRCQCHRAQRRRAGCDVGRRTLSSWRQGWRCRCLHESGAGPAWRGCSIECCRTLSRRPLPMRTRSSARSCQRCASGRSAPRKARASSADYS